MTSAIAFSAFGRYQTAVEMGERRLIIEQEAAALEARRDDLMKQVEYLSDDRGIEAEIRRQFDVAREGEKVVVIVESEAEEAPLTIPVDSTSTTEKRWYEFWH
jgi:cell division protein FtsB